MKRTVFKENKKVMREYQNEKKIDPECTFLLFKNKISGLLDYRIFMCPGVTLSPEDYDYIFKKCYFVEISRNGRDGSMIVDEILEVVDGTAYRHLTFYEE